jgi:hypothetical protein
VTKIILWRLVLYGTEHDWAARVVTLRHGRPLGKINYFVLLGLVRLSHIQILRLYILVQPVISFLCPVFQLFYQPNFSAHYFQFKIIPK